MKHWNPLAAAHAYYEGWSLFDADGQFDIQRIDDPDAWIDNGADPSLMLNEFDSDDQALAWVMLCAIAGSEMHRAVLRLHGKLIFPRHRHPEVEASFRSTFWE